MLLDEPRTEPAPARAAVLSAAQAKPIAPRPLVVTIQQERPTYTLGLVAVLMLILVAVLIWKDFAAMLRQQGGRADALRIWEREKKKVEDTSNGWFPTYADPLFSWEKSTQGWVYEADSPAAKAGGPLTLPSPPGGEGRVRGAGAATTEADVLRAVATGERERPNALSVPVHFPNPATVSRPAGRLPDVDPNTLMGVRFVSYDVLVPRECPGYVGCLLFLKDKDGLWYQARTRAAMVPGVWTPVTADIRGNSPDVTPLGHLGQWDDNQATGVKLIGITFYGDKPFDGKVLLANFRGWMRGQRFAEMAGLLGSQFPAVPESRKAQLMKLVSAAKSVREDPVRLINLRTAPPAPESSVGGPPAVRRFETFTLRFELSRQVDNPFDPEKADITCLVKTPSGKSLEHVGFWYQDYDRTQRFEDDDLKPMGRPEWRVRITPREPGEYSYQLRVKLGNEPMLELPPRTFVCQPSSEGKGFLRVSERDKRFLEFETGSFFYPIGHNVSTPVDMRCWREIFKKEPPAGRGLAMYMDVFDKMEANRENTVEVWMASWWLGIEWTTYWKDYYGPRRYSLPHAWKLDYLLDLARQHGLYIHLVLDNHGKFSQWCDWEWDNNPYNSHLQPNGIVATAQEFFSSQTARKWHKNKLRYIAARWGSDPAILGWELVSEYDLVGGTAKEVAKNNHPRMVFHRSPVLQDWARDMIGYLRRCDVYGHPVTNHYATDYTWIDVVLAGEVTPDGRPLYDYIATDAYRKDRPYTGAALRMQEWVNTNLPASSLKPFWITEYGGDFDVGVPASGLAGDVHSGMWATWMTDGMGMPLFWWYDFIDTNNLYGYYRAFANFIEGEDRRGIAGITVPLKIGGGSSEKGLKGLVYHWNNGAYVWIYENAAMDRMPGPNERASYEGVLAGVPGLQEGKYSIEYWDCFEGKAIGKEYGQDLPAGQNLKLKFPLFKTSCAVKVKKLP